MQVSKLSKVKALKIRRRLPLTLNSQDYAFIESCVSLKQFHSIDEFFDAAIALYQKHLDALSTYTEDQLHKGLSRAEILESIECEIIVTKKALVGSRRKRVNAKNKLK